VVVLRAALMAVRAPGWLYVVAILPVAALTGALIAMLTEQVAYRPIRGGSRLVALLTAIGASCALQNAMKFVRGGNHLAFDGPILTFRMQSVLIGGTGFPVVKFGFVAITLVLMLGLWWLVMRTRFGRAMRATSQDLVAARLMGVDVDRVILLTFALGGAFAGVAGCLVGALHHADPMMGFMPGITAFVAAVVGGIGSIPGAVLGGFLLGLLQVLVVWAGVPESYSGVVTFGVLIAVLVVKPEGLLGRPETVKV
jgi:branched-chain amino acid transport system permease protein